MVIDLRKSLCTRKVCGGKRDENRRHSTMVQCLETVKDNIGVNIGVNASRRYAMYGDSDRVRCVGDMHTAPAYRYLLPVHTSMAWVYVNGSPGLRQFMRESARQRESASMYIDVCSHEQEWSFR